MHILKYLVAFSPTSQELSNSFLTSISSHINKWLGVIQDGGKPCMSM